MRRICLALPEAHEVVAHYPPGASRWRIRSNTFATTFCYDLGDGPVPIVEFIARGIELDALIHVGPPFYKSPWGGDVVTLALSDDTDWQEAAEVIADSYCIMAPKKLAAIVRGES